MLNAVNAASGFGIALFQESGPDNVNGGAEGMVTTLRSLRRKNSSIYSDLLKTPDLQYDERRLSQQNAQVSSGPVASGVEHYLFSPTTINL
jgi:hypothetical protein